MIQSDLFEGYLYNHFKRLARVRSHIFLVREMYSENCLAIGYLISRILLHIGVFEYKFKDVCILYISPLCIISFLYCFNRYHFVFLEHFLRNLLKQLEKKSSIASIARVFANLYNIFKSTCF